MFFPARIAIAVALAAATSLASAQERTPAPQDPARSARVSAVKVDRGQLQATRTASATAPKAGTEIATSVPPLPSANPLRAYPPSCLAEPLPDQTSGPTWSTTANLAAFDTTTGEIVLEGVNIIVWRVVCSSSEFLTSATLMRIQRQAQFEGDRDIYPLFPSIEVDQGSIDFGDLESLVRSTTAPNTVSADILPDTPIVDSTTYVLENYSGPGAGYFDFNLSFGLRFDNLFSSNNFFFINVPTYNPTVGTYPAAYQDLPISGYMSTNWFDPDAGGEGIVLQIYERPNEANILVVSFTWFAYDDDGFPFWLVGQADIVRGARSVTAPMVYLTGGGLGGNGGAAGPPQAWGTATVSFPDCNSMILSYDSNSGLPPFVPQGNGTRNWIRLASVNALRCE